VVGCGWPLLPVEGGQLVPLLPLERSPVVLPGGDSWPAGLSDVLTKLGVWVLDSGSFELPVEVLSSHCAHKPSGMGVAAAMCSAFGWSPPQQQQQQQQLASERQRDHAHPAAGKLSAAETHLLRRFMLQRTWFESAAAGTAAQQQLVAVAQQLPLYQVANPGVQQQAESAAMVAAAAASPGSDRAPAAAAAAWPGPVFVPLSAASRLAPPGVLPAALGGDYVLPPSDTEAAVMTRFLGVSAPSAAAVYRADVLPGLARLPAAVRDRAVLHMLRALPQLQQQDAGLPRLLAATPFLPNSKGELHTPDALYDPRSPELAALLDPEACFPAPAFCGADERDADAAGARADGSASAPDAADASGGGAFNSLAALQQLGLRSAPHLGTFVAAAHYVQRLVQEGEEDLAVARGLVRCSAWHALHASRSSLVLRACSWGAQGARTDATHLPTHARAALRRPCWHTSTRRLSGWLAGRRPSPTQRLPSWRARVRHPSAAPAAAAAWPAPAAAAARAMAMAEGRGTSSSSSSRKAAGATSPGLSCSGQCVACGAWLQASSHSSSNSGQGSQAPACRCSSSSSSSSRRTPSAARLCWRSSGRSWRAHAGALC
jgi:hypothetical protein